MSTESFTDVMWDLDILPAMCAVMKIESSSPDYDPTFLTNGQHDKVVSLVLDWLHAHLDGIPGTKVNLLTEPRRTPFIHAEIPPSDKSNKGVCAMYGHIDRQPPLDNWTRGGPYDPTFYDSDGNKTTMKDPKKRFLYCRGSCDDVYALFMAVAAVLDCRRKGLPHSKIILLIESAEESDHVVDGVSDLEFWLRKLNSSGSGGEPAPLAGLDTLVALDSGGPDFSRLWLTSSLRGVGAFYLSVAVSDTDVHSGVGGGLIPDPQRIVRILLARLEDTETGEIKLQSLHPKEIPEAVIKNIANVPAPQANFVQGCTVPAMKDAVTASLATTWKPCITVTGISASADSGSQPFPDPQNAGNVIRGGTTVKVSVRLPPMIDPKVAEHDVKTLLTENPPYGCRVEVRMEEFCAGWVMPTVPEWLDKSLAKSSAANFGGNVYGATGLGGSIPFVELLGQLFPKAAIVVTGVLGANGNNAHVKDEFLEIVFAKKVQQCINGLVADHGAAFAAPSSSA